MDDVLCVLKYESPACEKSLKKLFDKVSWEKNKTNKSQMAKALKYLFVVLNFILFRVRIKRLRILVRTPHINMHIMAKI